MVQHPLPPLLIPQQYLGALIPFALGIVVYLLPARLLVYFAQEAVEKALERKKTKQFVFQPQL